MEQWLIYTLVGIGALIVASIFEPSREFLVEQLEELWTGIEYFLSFEWIGDLWEFLSSGFQDLSEFSTFGLALGVMGIVLIYYLRDYTLAPFIQYYEPAGAIFWTIITYLGVFVGGYILGNAFENS